MGGGGGCVGCVKGCECWCRDVSGSGMGGGFRVEEVVTVGFTVEQHPGCLFVCLYGACCMVIHRIAAEFAERIDGTKGSGGPAYLVVRGIVGRRYIARE